MGRFSPREEEERPNIIFEEASCETVFFEGTFLNKMYEVGI